MPALFTRYLPIQDGKTLEGTEEGGCGAEGSNGGGFGEERGLIFFIYTVQTSFTIVFAAGLGFIFNSDPDLISAVLI